MERGQAVPVLTRCQTAPREHLQHHWVLTIDTYEVSMAIFLNGRPLCGLVLRQAVEVHVIQANRKRQDRKQERNGGIPMPTPGTILKLIQHRLFRFHRERLRVHDRHSDAISIPPAPRRSKISDTEYGFRAEGLKYCQTPNSPRSPTATNCRPSRTRTAAKTSSSACCSTTLVRYRTFSIKSQSAAADPAPMLIKPSRPKKCNGRDM